MKFLHLGDLHLGRTLGEYSLIEDQRFILDEILDIAKENKVGAVMIAGDVYDKRIPSEKAVELLDYFLDRLAALKIKVFLISGNHDSEERLHFGSGLFEKNGIYICAKFDGKLYRQTMEDKYGKVNICLLPFIRASLVKNYYPEEEIDTYDKAVRVVLKNAGIDPKERNILLAHQFVVGKGTETELSGSESLPVRNVGLVEQIGADGFDNFDYVALGHIHSPQKILRDEVRYCGSPLKYSVSEASSKKKLPLVTIEEKGKVSVELIPLKPKRDLRHIRGKMKQLLDKTNIVDPEDYIYVTLTDEDTVMDAMGVIRQYYPNIVKLDYDNAHTRELGEGDFVPASETKTFPELFQDFYRMIYGCEMDPDEVKLMEEMAKEN